jgi:hypothetical protein
VTLHSPNVLERLSEKGRRSLQRSTTEHPKRLFCNSVAGLVSALYATAHQHATRVSLRNIIRLMAHSIIATPFSGSRS